MGDIYIVGLDHFLQNQQAFCLTAAGVGLYFVAVGIGKVDSAAR